MKIRSLLMIVVLSTLLPVLFLAIFLSIVFHQQQRSAFDLRYLERVRAFGLALDRELDAQIHALQILAQSDSLQAGDLKRFYERAARTRAVQTNWANIILNDPETGVQLINLRLPFGTPLGETTVDRETLNRVVRTGKPFIPPLLQGRVSGRYSTAIVVPVRSAGRTYTLVAIIDPAAWLNFLSSYPIASDATMTLLDQNGLVIARTLNNEKWVGHRVSPGLYEQSRKSPEGAYKNIGLEGQMFYSAHSRLKVSDWTIATGVPSERVEAVLWKSDLTIGVALIIVASAALLLAYKFGRQINDAFVTLARSAGALIRGETPLPGSSFHVREATEVGTAFQKAALELKSRAVELRETEERFRTMADTAPVLIWESGTDTRCTYFNQPWLTFTGRTLEQELGDGWTAAVHPDDFAACVGKYEAAFDKRESFELEYRLIRADGEYRWVLDRGTPRYTSEGEFAGYIGSCIDITERKEADEALRQAREQLQTVTDRMSAAVASYSADQQYRWVSVGYSLWLNKPIAEIAGRSISDVIGKDAYRSIRPFIDRVLAGERVEYGEEINFSGIGRRWISAVYTPTYSAAKQPDGWVAVITDITERKKLEGALRESEHKLRQRAEELEKQLIASGRLVSVGEITASMAHEFNNPLGVIIGFAEDLLSNTSASDPNFQIFKIVHEESKRCAKLVQDMLEFSSPRVADFSPTDIGAVVTKSLSFISARLYKDKIEEKARIAEHLPPVHADPVQMEQVLLNLYLNAIDAMPSGGKLTIEVTTDAGANDGGKPHVVISVADTGTGINPEHLAKIFQPFFTANKKSGLGLGLAITERIIKNHGGRIQVDSHLGQGTRFTIYLPSTFSQSDQQGTGRVEAAS